MKPPGKTVKGKKYFQVLLLWYICSAVEPGEGGGSRLGATAAERQFLSGKFLGFSENFLAILRIKG